MSEEERKKISECRLSVAADHKFIEAIKQELARLNFDNISYTESEEDSHLECCGHLIVPVDLIEGAAVIVYGEGRSAIPSRLQAAEYVEGFCLFWNMPEAKWIQSAIPSIRAGETSKNAIRTAALMCARIAANIAVGREVKTYPRFYISRNL